MYTEKETFSLLEFAICKARIVKQEDDLASSKVDTLHSGRRVGYSVVTRWSFLMFGRFLVLPQNDSDAEPYDMMFEYRFAY